MPDWRFSRWFAAWTIMGSILLLSGLVTANPIPNPGNIRVTGPSDIMLLLSTNFVTNLFLFAGFFLLFGTIWNKNIGRLDSDRNRFVLQVLAAVSLITFLGVLIDLGLVYQDSYMEYRVLKYNGASWMLAVVLVFASIYLASHYIVKIRRRVSALIGAGMGVVNLAFWFHLLNSTEDPAFIPLLLLFILPILLFLVFRWHRNIYIGGPSARLPPGVPYPPPAEVALPALKEPKQAPVEASAGPKEDAAPRDIGAAVDAMER